MTLDETNKLLAMVRVRYPTSTLWEQNAAMTAAAWHRTLADVPYDCANAALDEWMRVEKWPPDPSELRERVRARAREREREQANAALRERYRRPALGEGWMERARRANATNAEITEHVVSLATAWREGALDLAGVRGLSRGYERFVALNHERVAVQPLVEALAADDDARAGLVQTTHGAFTPQDIREHGGIVTRLNGRCAVRWPTSGSAGGWRYGEEWP